MNINISLLNPSFVGDFKHTVQYQTRRLINNLNSKLKILCLFGMVRLPLMNMSRFNTSTSSVQVTYIQR